MLDYMRAFSSEVAIALFTPGLTWTVRRTKLRITFAKTRDVERKYGLQWGRNVTNLSNHLNPIRVARQYVQRKVWRKTFTERNSFQGQKLADQATVFVPVYGQLKFVRRLLTQLLHEQKLSKFKLVVIDDRLDTYSSEWLETFLKDHKEVQLLQNSENLGFGRAINAAIARDTRKYAVILNSDVEIPSGAIERILAPLADERTALATSPATSSGANLDIVAPLGRHWKEVDSWLQLQTPSYPDVTTAIGYALAIDLSLVNRIEVFDEAYIDGYGEDSDLHYQVVSMGLRSVLVDNMLVHHESGISYSSKDSGLDFRRQNVRTFQERWAAVHKKSLKRFERSRTVPGLQAYIDFCSTLAPMDSDVVIITPTVIAPSGGGSMLIDLFEELWRSGLTARIVPMDGLFHRSKSWAGLPAEQALNGLKTSVVVSSDPSSFVTSEKIGKKLGTPVVNFFQGPEMFFNNGASHSIAVEHLERVSSVICVSPFLAQLALLSGARDVRTLQMGPDMDTYYPSSRFPESRPKVLLSSRPHQDKGAYLLPLIGTRFSKAGFDVVSIGPTHASLYLDSTILNLGQIDATRVCSELQGAQYLIDTSSFEGLGLVPLEALASGCKPIITSKGGVESLGIPKDLYELVTLAELFDEELPQRLVPLSEDQVLRAREFFERYNQHLGLSQAVKELESIIKRRI